MQLKSIDSVRMRSELHVLRKGLYDLSAIDGQHLSLEFHVTIVNGKNITKKLL